MDGILSVQKFPLLLVLFLLLNSFALVAPAPSLPPASTSFSSSFSSRSSSPLQGGRGGRGRERERAKEMGLFGWLFEPQREEFLSVWPLLSDRIRNERQLIEG